ncbi:YigZ family protein [Chakrabartyella piscis]|uniref:YigZ family protein n=1 Tax=Chakrabartyella piscis TaxID=2918914 RepID=UPI0029584320|nr:YigZ family protein [Chakrabartyella piscis]
MDQYRVIYGDKNEVYTDEIVEKKSKFIANIKTVESEEEAVAFINEIKKKYYDARHNCSAFVVGTKKELVRSSDDGEPSGTAGKPMLEVLLGSDIVNVVAVVTRYFGGTLLGTGGLVRAYTQATQAGLSCCKTAIMCPGKRVEIHTDYNTIGKVLYELGQRGIEQEDSAYTDVISITVTVPEEEFDGFAKCITEISSGKSNVEVLEDVFFAKVE